MRVVMFVLSNNNALGYVLDRVFCLKSIINICKINYYK